MPREFFGTITGLILAVRGFVPLHASAVEIAGRGVLVFGRSGAGKSSLVAALIGFGARLISDDLTALRLNDKGFPELLPGRIGLRLLPPSATLLGSNAGRSPTVDAGGKLLFMPPRMTGIAAIPLRHIAQVDAVEGSIPAVFASALLNDHIYRRRSVGRLPGEAARYAVVKKAISLCGMDRFKGLADRDIPAFTARAKLMFDAVSTSYMTE